MNQAKQLIATTGLWVFFVPFRRLMQTFSCNVSYQLSCAIAKVAALFFFRLERRLYHYLKTVFPERFSDRDLRTIARQSIVIDLKRRLEDLTLGQMTRSFVEDHIFFEGKEHLVRSVAQGKGTIILLSHAASFLKIPPAIGYLGYPISQLGGKPELKSHTRIHRTIFEIRKKDYDNLPISFLRADKELRKVLKALKKNELIAIAIDGREGTNWAPVDFLGKPARFATGPARMAQSTGANVVQTFMVRQPDDTIKIIFTPPVPVSKQDDLTRTTQRFVTVFEDFVLAHPSHFAMIMYIMKGRTDKGVHDTPMFDQDNNQRQGPLSERNPK